MASITSTGIGSQLDVESIITQLMAIEKKPLTALQTTASTLDSKISAFGTLKSQLSALSDAATKLAAAATWNAKTASSSNATALSASVTNAGDAVASSFTMQVSQLARAQAVSSNAAATGTGFGLGTLSIQLGDWNDTDAGGPNFAAGDKPAIDISVNEGDSLSAIAAKINGAGAGVSATVLKDLSGERLMLRSSSTGEAAGFRVTATPLGSGDGADLGLLAFDGTGQGMGANPVQYARNAEATINGVTIRSATNVLADTVPGVSLTLSQVTTSPVEVAVATDTSGLRGTIQAFVTAYNTMNQTLNSATAYDAASKTAALLQGDSTAVSLQNALRSLVGAPSGGGAIQRLSDLGITVAKDGAGNLALDTAKLDTALKNPAAVQQFFAAPQNTLDSSATGFATRLSAFTQAAIATDGTLDTRTQSLKAQRKDNDKSQDNLSDRLTLTEKRLRAQYTALDTKMASLTALNTYITQQVAQWNKSTS